MERKGVIFYGGSTDTNTGMPQHFFSYVIYASKSNKHSAGHFIVSTLCLSDWKSDNQINTSNYMENFENTEKDAIDSAIEKLVKENKHKDLKKVVYDLPS